MSLRHYVTSVHIKKESQLEGYIVCEDVGDVSSLFSQHLI